ncbi:hypothetical protein B6U66_04260 [Candidatus Bathyarchaeota archaeon ex4484_135]|nr:MAG: hypothetical protein B6U66_04260 [Candidatus Bathyarchaeota archaeon ex4484_135]
MARERFKVALAQMECSVGDKEANLAKMEEMAKRAKREGADLVVFPELSATGYVCRDLFYELAEPVPGPATEKMAEVARETGLYIVFGLPEKSRISGSVLYNTSVLVGPGGFVGSYRKMFLPTHSVFEEKRYFRPGDKVEVFDTGLCRIGLMICYDVFFPEVARLLRLKGAQFIVCISASPGVRRSYFETLLSARALENTVHLAYVNLVGREDGLGFWGGSRLIGPTGSIIVKAKYDEEDMVMGEVDLHDAERAGVFLPMLRDLRPELTRWIAEEASSY